VGHPDIRRSAILPHPRELQVVPALRRLQAGAARVAAAAEVELAADRPTLSMQRVRRKAGGRSCRAFASTLIYAASIGGSGCTLSWAVMATLTASCQINSASRSWITDRASNGTSRISNTRQFQIHPASALTALSPIRPTSTTTPRRCRDPYAGQRRSQNAASYDLSEKGGPTMTSRSTKVWNPADEQQIARRPGSARYE
jgi:hypothetical protein